MSVISDTVIVLETCFLPMRDKQQKEGKEDIASDKKPTRIFLWVVRMAVGLSSLAFLLMIFLAFQVEMSEPQTRLFEICDTTWKIGFAAILGLIGGRVSYIR